VSFQNVVAVASKSVHDERPHVLVVVGQRGCSCA
jgi:hypothetical protein